MTFAEQTGIAPGRQGHRMTPEVDDRVVIDASEYRITGITERAVVGGGRRQVAMCQSESRGEYWVNIDELSWTPAPALP